MSRLVQPRVLVVDDEQTILLSVSDYLTQKGYEVHCARTPSEAKSQLELRQYAGAIIDLRLNSASNSSGLELVRHARNTCPKLKMIVLTAYGTPAHQQEARQLGVEAFLSKPQPLSELASILSKLLNEKEPRIQPAAANAGLKQPPATAVSTGVKHLLLIDSTPNASMHKAQFSMAAGAGCVVVPNIPDAVAEISKQKPALVLLDCATGALEGDAALAKLTEQRRSQDLPLVMLASNDTPTELIESGFRADADDCLMMPVRLPEIQARLTAVNAAPIAAGKSAGNRGPKTVLFACGNAPLNEQLADLLKLCGFHLLYSAANEKAVQAAVAGPDSPDLVIFCSETPNGSKPTFSRLKAGIAEPLPTLLISQSGPPGSRAQKGHVWLDNSSVSMEMVLQKAQTALSRHSSQIQVADRVPFFCPVQSREVGKANETWSSSYSFHISPGAIFLRTLVPMRTGAALEIKIHMTNVREILEGTGVVAWANTFAPKRTLSYPIGMGVQFLGMSPKRLGQLREICRAAAGL